MVRVVKNNYVRRCKCSNCESILEYEPEDTVKVRVSETRCEEFINCLACGKDIEVTLLNKQGISYIDDLDEQVRIRGFVFSLLIIVCLLCLLYLGFVTKGI